VLVHRAALNRDVGPKCGQRLLEAGSAIDDDKLRRLQAAFDQIVEKGPPPPATLNGFAVRGPDGLRQAASLSPPLFFTASSTFWPSWRTPSATKREIEVAFLSSRTRTTVPSRMRRMIGSSARERAFHPSQSPFTFRQTRLTTSLPTEPA
jgi:hypothetical protein